MLRRPAVVAAALFVLIGCSRSTPPTAAVAPQPKEVGPVVDVAPPTHPMPPGATAGKAEPECAATPAEAAPKAVQIGARAAEVRGTTLAFTTPDADGQLVLGVLGPFNEDSPGNLAALPQYLAFFAAEKVGAIVVAGDSGETEEGIARILEEIAKTNLPTLVVIGNRECRADYVGAVRAVAARHTNVVDMNQMRTVRFAELALVSLPGYHDANFINCQSGCRYFTSTVDEVIALAKAQTVPVALVAHGPPLGEGSQSLDYASATGNVGDPEIRRALAQASIPFGLFTHIKEAGARATDLAGTTLIPQGTFKTSLYLNPGPANTAKWKMNDGTSGFGFAATMTLKGREASWKSFRLAAPAASDKPLAPTTPPPGRAKGR